MQITAKMTEPCLKITLPYTYSVQLYIDLQADTIRKPYKNSLSGKFNLQFHDNVQCTLYICTSSKYVYITPSTICTVPRIIRIFFPFSIFFSEFFNQFFTIQYYCINWLVKPSNHKLTGIKTESVTVGAAATVYVWFLHARYTRIRVYARHSVYRLVLIKFSMQARPMLVVILTIFLIPVTRHHLFVFKHLCQFNNKLCFLDLTIINFLLIHNDVNASLDHNFFNVKMNYF